MGVKLIAGVDEVGRGCIAGSVIAAAVIRGYDVVEGLADSKRLNEATREALSGRLKSSDWLWAIGEASVTEIDSINILHASLLAMERAISALPRKPSHILVDGNRVPKKYASISEAIVGGDAKVSEIKAASIIAKVHRDRMMRALHQQYPQYGLAQHKGYPTKAHIEAIKTHGLEPFYRTTFAPVARILSEGAV